ncbi:MAG: hypothetical protein R3B06_12205 [Kofleriaceae bacterium]
MSNGTTDNTAVRALIEAAQGKHVDADDALFEPARKPLLPPPFPARAARASMPPPLPRHRAPSSTRTDLHAAPPPAPQVAAPVVARRPSEHEVPTRPFDQIELDELTEEPTLPPPVLPAPAARIVGAPTVRASAPPVAPRPSIAPRPPAAPVDRTPSVEAAFWAAGDAASVDVDLADVAPAAPARLRAARRYAPRAEATQIARMPRPGDNRRAWMWIAGSFVVGVTATILIVAAGRGPSASAPGSAAAPAAAAGLPAVAPLAAPVVQPLAMPVDTGAPPPAAVPVAPAEVAPAEVAAADVPVADVPTTVEAATAAPAVAPVVSPRPASPARPPRGAASAQPKAPIRPRASTPAAPPAPRVAAATPAPRAAAAPAAGGVLQVGAKPPCEIVIDGKATGLTTPQRAIKVVPGDHRITLINRAYRINESVTVVVKAGASVKVIKDLTSKMKR